MANSGRKSFQLLAAAASNLCQLTNGFAVSMSSYGVPQMLKGEGGLQFTEEQTSWFASMLAIGQLTGAVHGGFVSDKIGRKKSILIDCVGLALSFLMIGYFEDFNLILLGRFLAGHFIGSNMVATPIFVGEISQPSIRSFTGSMLMIEYCSGFTLSMLLGAIFPWRTVACLAALFPAVGFCIMLVMKESPSWLLRQKCNEEANGSLTFYRGNPDVVREELDRMQDNINRIEKQKSAMGDSDFQRLKCQLKRLTESTFLKPFILLNLMLNIGLEWGGFPALAYYMHTILEEVKVPVDPYSLAVVLSAFRSVICIGLSFILFKVPRRPMYMLSGSMVAFSLFCQAAFAWLTPYISADIMVYARWIPLLALFLQYLGFSLGWGAIMYIMQGEILPSDMRSIGSGLLGIIDNVFLFLSVKSIPTLISSVGVGGMFSIYCVMVLGVLCIAFFTMPETKGMSLEDIEDFYTAMKQTQQTMNEKKLTQNV
eukprot:TRINITY_DN22405_c0_g1_i2.p1 TRINITY_DN22405_c0_g1~~TRINITY_DN22405_c0_g1_i2.p1  ORF type:complete len:516 (-),score=34.93 TRINITY_DN22405_c0_g1_i2:32-1480(-)